MSFQEVINEDPEPYIVKLFENACDSIWISTRLNPIFYNREAVSTAITNAMERVKEFHLLLDVNVDYETRKQQIRWFADLVDNKRITVRKSDRPIPHWMIIDGKYFRLEKTHLPNETESKIETSNLIIWDTKSKLVAEALRNRFKEWWNSSSAL